MKCAKCQTENEREALYCKMCGTSMSECAGEAASAFVEAKPVMLDPVPESAPAVATVAATIATSYPHTESAADFARYQRKLADKAEQVRDAREVAALNAADHEVYRRRRRNCLVVGIVLDFARYQRKLADKAEQVRDAREVAALNAADHEVYRRRRRNCLVVGIVLVVLFAMMYPSWTGSFAGIGGAGGTALSSASFSWCCSP